MFRSKVAKVLMIAPVMLVLAAACAHLMMNGTPKPPASEFGFGPRTSAGQTYRVVVEETQPYKVGKLLSSVVRIESSTGEPVQSAQIDVDGGMPQHGHGLPTRPRVSRELGAGRYEIGGLKFNMGGWWELKFRIRSGTAVDSVTFNLAL